MTIVPLYKYSGSNGCIISPVHLNFEHTDMYRLVADNRMVLTDGLARMKVVDVEVDNKEVWKEVYENDPTEGITEVPDEFTKEGQ